jgi:hypothetical protein
MLGRGPVSPAPGGAGAEPKLRFMDSCREVMRHRHLALRTEETYLQWIRRFIVWSGKRHPQEMGAVEVRGRRPGKVGRRLRPSRLGANSFLECDSGNSGASRCRQSGGPDGRRRNGGFGGSQRPTIGSASPSPRRSFP